MVNIGTAANLFQALNESLAKNGLGFSNAVAFMSDTTNVMKGKRSGVQKLIRDENPFLLDVGCICHLADLTVKAGLETLPVDINQLFIDIFYFFQHSSKRNSTSLISGVRCLPQSQMQFSSTAQPDGSAFFGVSSDTLNSLTG